VLLKATALLRLFGLRIPLLLFVGPRVLELDEAGCAIEIPLGIRTKNHLGSMYFGVLCVGADVAAGLNAAALTVREHRGVRISFKDLKADFLKRADGDVVFRSRDGARVRQAVEQAASTGERVTLPVDVVATVPEKYGEEPVARFTLGLSMKRR
jgi:acyl-coenzyme A thioesterase PaaI-like protein